LQDVARRVLGRLVTPPDPLGVSGQVILSRATGHGPPAAAGKAELGYLFLPEAWGFGYAAEACAAALGWLARELPGEPVVLFTQTANARSMRLAAKLGFTEIERFEAYGAEQWYGMRPPVAPPIELTLTRTCHYRVGCCTSLLCGAKIAVDCYLVLKELS
jgi:hypothetical protein